MLYGIWFILGIFSMLKKRSKLATALMLLFLVCVFCLNTGNPDYDHYEMQYNGIRIFGSEPIFAAMNRWFFAAGISYGVFRAVLSLIGLALVACIVLKYSPYPALSLFVYSIYPMTMDVTQLRFFVAYAIVVFGIRFIIHYQLHRTKRDILFFLICIALATGFHYSSVMYLSLALLLLNIDRHKLLYMVIVPVAIVVFTFCIDRFAPVIEQVIGARKTRLWIVGERDNSVIRVVRILFNRAMPLLYFGILQLVSGKRPTRRVPDLDAHFSPRNPSVSLAKTENAAEQKTDRVLFVSMLYSLMFVGLEISISGEYERISRVGLLAGLLLFTRKLSHLNDRNRRFMIALLVLFQIVYLGIILYFMMFKYEIRYFDYVFRSVMENNWLLELLH